MDFPDYVQSISFRIPPADDREPVAVRLAAVALHPIGLSLDVLNTRLPCEQGEMRRRLRDPKRCCPAGIFAVGAVINRAVRGLDVHNAFVALGIGDGFPLLAAISENQDKRCIGVDWLREDDRPQRDRQRETLLRQFDRRRSDLHTFHVCDHGDDLANLQNFAIGFCFVGADANGSLVTRLKTAEPHLAENAILLVENANEAGVHNASLAFINDSSNQYRILLDRRTFRHSSLTFGNGVLLFQLLGRNAVAGVRTESSLIRPAA